MGGCDSTWVVVPDMMMSVRMDLDKFGIRDLMERAGNRRDWKRGYEGG